MIRNSRQVAHEKRLAGRVLSFYKNNAVIGIGGGQELQYIQNMGIAHMINYPFKDEMMRQHVDVFFDKERKLKYVIHNNKRLYYPREWVEDGIRRSYIATALIEQHPESPHRYVTKELLSANKVAVIIDVGAAEGIVALDFIDIADEVILLEADSKWFEALDATFEPWAGKVTIIKKFASAKSDENNIRLDEIETDRVKHKGKVFIKIDVEGMESEVLQGCEKLLDSDDSVFLCCTYHYQDDETVFSNLFQEKGFETELSDGYILIEEGPFNDAGYPQFRKGVLRAWK
jgi:hypothetical protein